MRQGHDKMFRSIIVFLFFLQSLFASSYPFFSHSEILKLKHCNKISCNRVLDYYKTIEKCKTLSKDAKLKKINFYLNRLLPQYDAVTKHQEDYWQTPKEFLKLGFGDCEDYAIIKYYSLIKLGFDEKKLFLTVVKDRYKGEYHMVLSYFKNKNKPPLLLDNLSFKILTLKQRGDLSVVYMMNSTGLYKIKDYHKLIKIPAKYKQFEELKVRVAHNH